MKSWAVLAAGIGLTMAISGTCNASDRMDDGLAAYSTRCAQCHDSGVNGAPRTHEPLDWENRSPLWESVLVEHARSGYLDMPAKGGDLNMPDYDLDVAAEYMLNTSHPDLPRD